MILKLLIPALLLASATAPISIIQYEGEEPETSLTSVPTSEPTESEPIETESEPIESEESEPIESEPIESAPTSAPTSVPASEPASAESVPTSEIPPLSDEEAKAKLEEELSKWFSPQTVAAIISVITALAAVLKLASSLKDLAKKNQLTIKNVTDAVKDQLPHEVQETLTPYLEDIEAREKELQATLKAFAKVLALSQENTPEAKLAILDAIEQLGVLQNGITGDAKKIVIAKKEAEDKKKEEIADEVGKVIESTDDGTSI